MSIQSLIHSIEIALLREGPSKIAVHTGEERETGERAVAPTGRDGGEITFLFLPLHLHNLVAVGTFLGEDAGEVEAEARNNTRGIQVIIAGREDG